MALSADRNTVRVGEHALAENHGLLVAAGAKIYQGAIVMIDAGYAKPGATAASKVAAGVAEFQADNTAGSNGAIRVRVRSGIFKFLNSGTDALAQADVGNVCYIEDDQTVSKTATGKTAAGRLLGLDTDGQCIVQMGPGLGAVWITGGV